MSDFTTNRICNAYQYISHLSGSSVVDASVFTGVGCNIPITFKSSDVYTSTEFALSNINTASSKKVCAVGALSAQSLYASATASRSYNTIEQLRNYYSSILTPRAGATLSAFVGVNNFYATMCTNIPSTGVYNTLLVHTTPQASPCNGYGVESSILLRDNASIIGDVKNSLGSNCSTINSVQYADYTNGCIYDGVGGCSSTRSYNGYATTDSYQLGVCSSRILGRPLTTGGGTMLNSSQAYGVNSRPFCSSYLLGGNTTAGSPICSKNNFIQGTDTGDGTNNMLVAASADYRMQNSLLLYTALACNTVNSLKLLSTSCSLSTVNSVILNACACSMKSSLSSCDGTTIAGCFVYSPSRTMYFNTAGTFAPISAYGINSFGGQTTYGTNSFMRSVGFDDNCDTCSVLCSTAVNSSYIGNTYACVVAHTLGGANSSTIMTCGGSNSGRNSLRVGSETSILNTARNIAILGASCSYNVSYSDAFVVNHNFIKLENLPTSATGLTCGHVWRDPSTCNLRIVLS